MKTDLLIHIGAHKTATTSIQAALAGHSAALARQGVAYVTLGREPNIHAALGRADPDALLPQGFHLADVAALDRALATTSAEKVIVSSENFSYFFAPEHIAALADFARARFARVRVLSYLRRQDLHLVSHHQEGAKPFRLSEGTLFGHSTRALPEDAPAPDRYLDYAQRIGMWLDVFGPENVEVRVFEPEQLVSGDPWRDFLDAAGLDPDGVDGSPRLNTSYGLTRAKVGHMMNARDLPTGTRYAVLEALPDDPRPLPARAQAERVYARYRSGNQALAARLGREDALFSEDFSSYPDVAHELWTEDSAEAAIAALLDVIEAREALPGADALRDASVLAEQAGQPELALALIRGAALLRPRAPAIQRRLARMEAQATARATAEGGD